MKIKVKDILKPCNISDSGCETKLMRFNDLLSFFSIRAFELYTMKYSQGFNATNCETVIDTKYPITHVWGFFTNDKCAGCSIQPVDCCEGWAKLLVNQGYLGELDKNMYSIEFPSKIHLKLGGNVGRGTVIYSRGFPICESLDDEIEIDEHTLALLRYFIKMEYALDPDNDSTLTQLYNKRFDARIEQLNKALGAQIALIPSGGKQIVGQF